jgi:hypothetical protein
MMIYTFHEDGTATVEANGQRRRLTLPLALGTLDTDAARGTRRVGVRTCRVARRPRARARSRRGRVARSRAPDDDGNGDPDPSLGSRSAA